jgi:carbon-monoxide dehydrogenase medium subunit
VAPLKKGLAKKALQFGEESSMIPGAFDYHRPATVSEAALLLRRLGPEARPLAGGHSLIPLMKTRLATPENLVDLSAVGELKGVRREGEEFVIGAMTTQHELIRSAVLAEFLPLLRETSVQIADPQVRYRGTIGGNVANGDPGNDMPAVMQCLDARFTVVSPEGRREIPARQFYRGAYDTALGPGDIVTEIRIKAPPASHGFAYEKLKRKTGDYATAAAAVVLTMDGGKCVSASVALTNVADTPLWAEEAGAILAGSDLGKVALDRAAAAAEAITSPASDLHGPAEYRAKMAGVMLRRAVIRAQSRARA